MGEGKLGTRGPSFNSGADSRTCGSLGSVLGLLRRASKHKELIEDKGSTQPVVTTPKVTKTKKNKTRQTFCPKPHTEKPQMPGMTVSVLL